jgi:hypothetical protein
MFEDDEDELSKPIEPATKWSLFFILVLGALWCVFFTARRSLKYNLAMQVLRIGYFATPPLAGLSLILGLVAQHRLRKRGFSQRGLAVISVAASAGALLAWLLFTIYRSVILGSPIPPG